MKGFGEIIKYESSYPNRVIIDPYNHESRYQKWKQHNTSRIPAIAKASSDYLLAYLRDMEIGRNVSPSSRKGARSASRLNTVKQRLVFTIKRLEERYGLLDISKVKEEQIYALFADMRTGAVRKEDGGIYKSTGDYVKAFKAFWHWHQRSQRKSGNEIPDLTIDLDSSTEKPKWVYLTIDQIRALCSEAKFSYRVLILFLFDAGLRAPAEYWSRRRSLKRIRSWLRSSSLRSPWSEGNT